MASHYVSASSPREIIKLYKSPASTAQVLEFLLQDAQVLVSEEYVGPNCKYHKVSSSLHEGYVANDYIFPLSGTLPSAPYTCNIPLPDFAYVEPEWQTLTSEQPFINDKTNEYCVCITSDFLIPSLVNEEVVLKDGISSLLRYYNKSGSYDDVQQYLNYYIFAKVKETFVPFRPLMRTKHLVTVARKYFDAVEEERSAFFKTPLDRNISLSDFVLKINLTEIEKKLNSLASLLGLYHTDIVVSNTSLIFSNSTIFEGQNVIQSPAVNEMSFDEKKENILKFKSKLEQLLSLNGIDPNPKLSIDDVQIQFAINSECNKIYDVSANINGECFPLRKGIEPFLKSEPVSDPTTVNFIKQIHNINKIDKCKVPWYNFAESYIYPSVEVLTPVIDDDLPDYDKFKKLYSVFLSFKQKSEALKVKTYEQIIKEEKDKFSFEFTNLYKTTTPFLRAIYLGDNVLDPTNLEKSFEKLEMAIAEAPINNNTIYGIQENGTYIEVKLSDDKTTAVRGEISNVSKSTFRLDTETPRIIVDGIETNLYISTAARQASDVVKRSGDSLLAALQKIHNLYIYKIGICKLIDLVWGCTLSLSRSLGIPIDETIQLAVIKNYKYDELINNIIPYLPAEQQQFLYEQILLDLGCLNKDSLLYTLKKFLSSDEYNTLNLETASYEDVIKTVANKMVVTIVSE